MPDTTYTKTELMICVAARLFEDASTCFIGTGIPMLAAMLASKTSAPNLVPVFEFGGMGALLDCRTETTSSLFGYARNAVGGRSGQGRKRMARGFVAREADSRVNRPEEPAHLRGCSRCRSNRSGRSRCGCWARMEAP